MRKNVRIEVLDRIEDPLGDRVRIQFGESPEAARKNVWSRVRFWVVDPTRVQLWIQVGSHIREQVGDPTWDQVWDQIEANLVIPV
jgi:hypothetical protein